VNIPTVFYLLRTKPEGRLGLKAGNHGKGATIFTYPAQFKAFAFIFLNPCGTVAILRPR
jgi:hypothetical protein